MQLCFIQFFINTFLQKNIHPPKEMNIIKLFLQKLI
jgi:hypothetical protein